MQMRPSILIVRLAIAACTLSLVAALLAGCNSSGGTVPPVSEAEAGNLQDAAGKKPRDAARGGGGGVPDMNEYPAPTGTKTGVLPGGRK